MSLFLHLALKNDFPLDLTDAAQTKPLHKTIENGSKFVKIPLCVLCVHWVSSNTLSFVNACSSEQTDARLWMIKSCCCKDHLPLAAETHLTFQTLSSDRPSKSGVPDRDGWLVWNPNGADIQTESGIEEQSKP